MSKKTVNIAASLKKLSKAELLKLANKKKARIPKSWTKPKIIQVLSIITTKKDLQKKKNSKLKTKIKTKTYQKKNSKQIKLEDRVTNIFQKKGYICTKNISAKDTRLNIFGFKKGGLFSSDKYIIIECKEKNKVTQTDLKKFLSNLILYLRRKNIDPECVKSYIYTTGEFQKGLKVQAKKFKILNLRRLKPNKKPR